jgi:acetyl-CoA carboxylase biotin carboxyl carrier protein
MADDEAARSTELNETLRLLREEMSHLVKTVPGPMASVSLRAGETSLKISWPHTAVAAGVLPPPADGPGGDEPPPADELTEVRAEIVGTFYVSPEPGATPFVEVGTRVEQGQTIGILEAMKLMNPVTAACAGEVAEVLVGDAEPVEFDQTLFRIRQEQS